MQIFKEGQANTIAVSKRLQEAFKEIEENPKLHGSDLAVLFAQGEVIEESLDTLLDSGKVGALLAALVLLFFLRRFRLTLIITLSIPLSLILSLTVIYFAGETLNILSLLGLIISVGLLVDNSVVVAENILRIFAEGASRRDACIKGSAEIALAIILATLTTIIVFLPVALVEGKGQFFLLRLAIPITVSLAASLFVALIFVPLCVYATLGAETQPKTEWAFVRRVHYVMDLVFGFLYEQTFGRISRTYSRVLSFALVRRLDLVVVVLAVFTVTMAGPGSGLEIVEVSEEDQQGFQIGVGLPSHYSLEEASAFFGEVETVLVDIQEELGLEGYFIYHASNFGQVQGWFEKGAKITRTEAAAFVLDRLPEKPGVSYYSGAEERGKSNERFSERGIVLTGEDPEKLEEVSAQLEERLLEVEGVVAAKRTMDPVPNELALVIDRTRSARQGVNPQHVAGVVAAGLRGQSLPRFQREGREIPVRLRFERSHADSLSELSDFSVPTASGQMVQLSALSEFKFLSSSRGIYRQEKRISRRITLDLLPDTEVETRKRIDSLLAGVDLPEGIRFHDGGDMVIVNEDVESMKFAALVSIVFIYLLMGFLFESFILPLSIIFTIPAAAMGVIWAHAIADRELDFLGFVGVILLIGVVVNNGIVFVDYVNRLRLDGMERGQAVLLAAERRFRPIMMTAATTIGGMIPLTIGEPSSIGISYRSFGLTLMGGMATATALTLLVVPIFYTLLDDASARTMALLRRALNAGTLKAPE
jgi:HAE1 family hydrophobic/amphiphilic exporter-1